MVLIISASTVFLMRKLISLAKLSPVRASSLLTLVLGGSFIFLEQFMDINQSFYLKVVFGASFVAMTNIESNNLFFWFIATFSYSLIFTFLLPLLPYSAGALGLCAFMAVCLSVISMMFILRKRE